MQMTIMSVKNEAQESCLTLVTCCIFSHGAQAQICNVIWKMLLLGFKVEGNLEGSKDCSH